MTDHSHLRFPITVAEWPRNSREVIRVALDQYGGRYTINVRVWWCDSDGTLKPGRAGIALSVKHLEPLARGLSEAVEKAREVGLL